MYIRLPQPLQEKINNTFPIVNTSHILKIHGISYNSWEYTGFKALNKTPFKDLFGQRKWINPQRWEYVQVELARNLSRTQTVIALTDETFRILRIFPFTPYGLKLAIQAMNDY